VAVNRQGRQGLEFLQPVTRGRHSRRVGIATSVYLLFASAGRAAAGHAASERSGSEPCETRDDLAKSFSWEPSRARERVGGPRGEAPGSIR